MDMKKSRIAFVLGAVAMSAVAGLTVALLRSFEDLQVRRAAGESDYDRHHPRR